MTPLESLAARVQCDPFFLESLAARVQCDPFFFAPAIARWADARGLDNAAICQRLGITAESLNGLRLYRMPTSLRNLYQIAEHFGLRPEVVREIAGVGK